MLTAREPTAAARARSYEDLPARSVVGPWRIEGSIGRGGMGTVYSVVHEVIGKRAAMKVIHRQVGGDLGTAAERLLVEARAVNAVNNPHIVDIFDSGTLPDGRPYLVMERLRGKTLGDRLDEGRIPPVEVIDYLLPLCDALAAAHAAGIIHRDIKLDNVFIVEPPPITVSTMTELPRPTIKLLDWGIASITEAAGGECTSQEVLIGTPRYIAPERAKGDRATAASDVYSLGVVAYELFLEEPPFHAPFAADILRMHLHDPPPPPSEVWPQIPPALEDLLLEMLSKTPSLRPTVVRVAEVLRDVRAGLVRAAEAVADAKAAAVELVVADEQSARARAARPTPDPAIPALVVAEPSVRAPVAVGRVGDQLARPEGSGRLAEVVEDAGAAPSTGAVLQPIEPEKTPMCSVVLEIPGGRERRWRWAAVASGMFAVGLTVKLCGPSPAPPAQGARMAHGTPAHAFAPLRADADREPRQADATVSTFAFELRDRLLASGAPNASYLSTVGDVGARTAIGTQLQFPAVTRATGLASMPPRTTAAHPAAPAARPSRPHPRPPKRPLHHNAVIDPY